MDSKIGCTYFFPLIEDLSICEKCSIGITMADPPCAAVPTPHGGPRICPTKGSKARGMPRLSFLSWGPKMRMINGAGLLIFLCSKGWNL